MKQELGDPHGQEIERNADDDGIGAKVHSPKREKRSQRASRNRSSQERGGNSAGRFRHRQGNGGRGERSEEKFPFEREIHNPRSFRENTTQSSEEKWCREPQPRNNEIQIHEVAPDSRGERRLRARALNSRSA